MNIYSKHVSLLLACSSIIHLFYPYEEEEKKESCNDNQQRKLLNIDSNEDHKTRPQEGIFLCLRRRKKRKRRPI